MIRNHSQLKKFKLRRHSCKKSEGKNHTKRFETTLSTFGYAFGASHCSRKEMRHTSTSYDRHGPNYRIAINTEAPCHKCGWKILYTEPLAETYNSKNGYNYYHKRCYIER